MVELKKVETGATYSAYRGGSDALGDLREISAAAVHREGEERKKQKKDKI